MELVSPIAKPKLTLLALRGKQNCSGVCVHVYIYMELFYVLYVVQSYTAGYNLRGKREVFCLVLGKGLQVSWKNSGGEQ